jgi:hypothetical protein
MLSFRVTTKLPGLLAGYLATPAIPHCGGFYMIAKTLQLGSGLLPFSVPRWLILISLSSAVVFSFQSSADSYRPLSRSEIKALNSLDYPQCERSMLNRFGRPLWSDGYYDYYPTHDNGMAQIPYVGNRDQGVRIHQ